MKIKNNTRKHRLLILLTITLFLITGIRNFGWSQSSQTFTANGTFTVPFGVTSITVQCWGAGGGGSSITSTNRRGGGGGGGAYAMSTVTVIPGNTYNIVVGNGGAASSAGGSSSFNATTVVAAGGSGGTNNSTNGGAGGSTAASTGTVEYAGGAGSNADVTVGYSGGGGGAAGSTGVGGAATGSTGGTGTTLNGGNGANGVTGSVNGAVGSTYGGGGSGAAASTATDRTGGAGASGLVIIEWCPVSGINYAGTPFCGALATPQPATISGATGGTFSANPAGLTIDAITGDIIPSTSNTGTYTVTYTLPSIGSCPVFTTTNTVTINPVIETPYFTLGTTSSRIQGAGSVTYSAVSANSTGITYSLDAASIAAGLTINATTGAVTYTAGWLGTSFITATAVGCDGPKTSVHTATTSLSPVYYSYVSGDWNLPGTWTFDPGGSTGPIATIPGNGDRVVILTGRIVSLPANVTNTNLDITINEGGILNQGTFRFTNTLVALRGGGTLRLASANFPTVTNNTFVTADGGITEYNTVGAFDLPTAQTVYYHLTINESTSVARQINNLTLNGDLYVKSGTYQINNNTAARRQLTIKKNLTVDTLASITVGTGNTVTGADAPLTVADGGTAPFLNYYNNETHRVVIQGSFLNKGTVRFTNQAAPKFDAFPNNGAATVYFQGSTDNTLICNGVTDFYNLVVDKGSDQTYKLTVYSSAYNFFRLFGANIARSANGNTANPNVKKALWIRNGSLILQGLTVIPSLSEGSTNAAPNTSHYIIPANGALVLDGSSVIVLSTADDFTEIQAAYSLTGGSNALYGINNGTASISGLSVQGRLQINNGYLSTRESSGLNYWSYASGQIIINGGELDTKQFDDASGTNTGLVTYSQTGGIVTLRGRFQNTINYLVPDDLTTPVINTTRADNGIDGTAGTGTFGLNTNAANGFIMSGGEIRIYDPCGVTATSYALLIGSQASNINVTGGSIQMFPTNGSGTNYDFLINTKAPFANFLVNRASGTSKVTLVSNPLRVLQNIDLVSGVFDANLLDVSIGKNFTIASAGTYLCTTTSANRTIFNGTTDQTFEINLAAAQNLNKLKIEKPTGSLLTLSGTQASLNVADSLIILKGTLSDGGKTINASGNIYNTGVHSGAGRIALISDIVQILDGNGFGVFGNLEINKPSAGTTTANVNRDITINGDLSFSGAGGANKRLNIQGNLLTFGSAATVTGATANRYIQTLGLHGDGGITKIYSSTSPSFTFHAGAPSTKHVGVPYYSPATITINGSATVYGQINVVPVGSEHPNTTTKNRSITYYWNVTSTGFTLGTATVTHAYNYNQTDMATEVGDITETGLVAARYTGSNYTWTSGTTDDVNETTNIIGEPGAGNFLENTAFIDGDYTAGDNNATNPFGIPTKFYSRQTGLWGTLSTWSLTSHTVDNPPLTAPGITDIVIIGGQDSVYLATNNTVANTDVRSCASLQIEAGSALDIGYNPNCNFGTVISHSNGNGNFRLTTSWNSGATFTFPSGDFSDFNINLGTTELYSTNPTAGTTYWLPNGITSYGNLILSPLGGSNIIFPNNDMITYGNLTTRGQNADSWFCPTWDVNYPTAPTARVAKTISVYGNLDIQGGALIWYGNGAITQNFVVYGNVYVAPNAAIDVESGATSQNISIGGDLINNTLGGIAAGTSTNRRCDFTLLPVTFFGDNSSVIANTANSPITTFDRVTVNKGSSQDSTLTLSIGGTLTTPVDNWLTLVNGTFRFMRTDPGTDFTISTTTPFTIPSTAGLYINYPNAGNRNVLIANAASNTNDLYLNGKLTVISGNVYIGRTNGTTINNNDIEYSSGGASSIDVKGGLLFVNGQIRRNASNSGGILVYNQEGGSVFINGCAAIATNAKLEVLNTGSSFQMSGGTLTLVRGGGNTFGDLYLRPQNSLVTGGSVLLFPGTTGAQTYKIDANIPLFNLTVQGSAGNVATAALMVSPLTVGGNMLIDANSIFNTNSINTTFKGNFTNNAGIAGYVYGTNTTTYNASNAAPYFGVQTLSGNTNFYNLVVSPGASLTVNNPCNVLNDLTLTSGTMILGSNLMQLSGNLMNNGRYIDAALANTGLQLIGTRKQRIAGTGIFGRLELINAYGAVTDNNISLEEDLVLTTGILDVNKNLLSLGLQSNILGAPFSASKMIKTDGVFSDVGVRKFFPIGATPAFLYPIGCGEKYTPATINITANNTVGYIRINNIDKKHPSVIDPANALDYYWEVESSGITGFSGKMIFSYMQSDVVGAQEANYIAARLIVPGTSWSKTNTLDPGNNLITFNHTLSNNLGGEYTGGIAAAFPDDVPVYTSNQNGNWTDNTIWTQTGGTTYPCPVGGPNGFIVVIDHEVTANANYCLSYRTTINNKLKIVSPYFGHNLGSVEGSGTLYLESGGLPAGVYTSFLECENNGRLEYGGTGTYTIVADLYNSVPFLIFSGTGSRILPNKDLTVCQLLDINGPILDNSLNNRKLNILGQLRLQTGAFKSGIGPNATVSFAGSSLQTIGGSLGNFIGTNAFNNFEINNSNGVNVNNTGSIEVKGKLLLTNGLINTNPLAPYNYGTITIVNTDISCVEPAGGSSMSFVNGPLTKKINQGDQFLFPIGVFKSGIGNVNGSKLWLSSSKTGTILWTAEYKNPNPTFASYTAPIQGVSSKEYWTVKAPAGSKSVVNINWDPDSDVTPLVTVNGLSDVVIGNYVTASTSWQQISTNAAGTNYYGTASSSNSRTSSGSDDYTLASLSLLQPKAQFTPSGPVCGNSGIPVSFIHPFPIPFGYVLNYSIDGISQTPVSINAVPYILPTPVAGTYKLTGFAYNNGLTAGVVDASAIVVSDIPTTADAGADQALCGITTAFLDANPGGVTTGTGVWSIISGMGGTLISPTSRTSQFIGLNGVSYVLRWTISNGNCYSYDEVNIHFTLVPPAPSAPALQTLCSGSTVANLTVTAPPGSTVLWYTTNVGGVSLANSQVLVAGNYYAESYSGSGCISLTRTMVTVTLVDEQWTGAISTNWNTPGNWSCGFVPTTNTDVQIPLVANQPILSLGAAGTTRNITIQANASLTVTGNTLRIAGIPANSGTFDATNGTIEFNGSVAQSVANNLFLANTIGNLTINNSLGVTLNGALGVKGIVNAATGDLTSNGNLTLLSDATQTALITGTGTGNVVGDVTMQRYLPSGFGYKYVSSPFQSATVNEFADDLNLGASFPTFYQYEENNYRDSSGVQLYTTGWINYVTSTNALQTFKGYAANFGNVLAPSTFDVTGVVNNNLATSITMYNHNRQYTKGFNLVGNPYPSPIDWDAAAGWTKANIDNAVYYFDAGTTNQYTGTYSSYVNGISSNGTANNIIPSMQGFFVHVSNGSYPVTATLAMGNGVRINTINPVYHKSTESQDLPLIRISASLNHSTVSDPAVVYFNDNATPGFDQQFDALKLMNTDSRVPNLFWLNNDDEKLSISAIPYPVDTITKIPIGLETETDGEITFKATSVENIPSGLNVYLSDESTGLIQDLTLNPDYNISLSAGSHTGRFFVLFSENELTGVFNSDKTFYANVENANLNVYVKLENEGISKLLITNMPGQTLISKELSGNGKHTIRQNLAAGIYLLTLYSSQGTCSQKIYIPK